MSRMELIWSKTKAYFSDAMAVMDRIRVWTGGGRIEGGSKI